MKYRILAAVLTGAVMELVLTAHCSYSTTYACQQSGGNLGWNSSRSFSYQAPHSSTVYFERRASDNSPCTIKLPAGLCLRQKRRYFLMQATIFACAALGIIYLLRLRRRPLSLRPQFVAAILGPPLFLLLLTGVVLLPNYVLSEEEAKIAMMLSSAWLAAAALLLAMAYLAKLTNGRILS